LEGSIICGKEENEWMEGKKVENEGDNVERKVFYAGPGQHKNYYWRIPRCFRKSYHSLSGRYFDLRHTG
jgi:hypothetical protein